MFGTTRVLVAAIVVLAGLAAPVAGQEDVVTMTVSVENQSGEPVRNATVTASWDGGSATARTAANGKAFVDVPSGATVEINVTHPQYVRNRPYVVEDAESEEVTVDMAQKGTITVGVTDAAGPVANATVVVRQDGRITTRGQTNADGQYRTETIEQGTYTVSVVKRGYYRNTTEVAVDGNVSTGVTLRRGSATLSFQVEDPHFDPDRPLGDVTLAVDSIGSVKTLPSGEAKLQVPVNSRLQLTAVKDGYATVKRTIAVDESDREVDVSMNLAPSLNVTSVNQRTVVGESVVVDVVDEYGDPVAGATITLDGESVATTDQSGRATVRINTTGEHQLVARTSNFTSDPVTVRAVSAADETTATTETATETTATTETTTDAGTTTETTPGFTPLTGVVALLAAAVLVALRRR